MSGSVERERQGGDGCASEAQLALHASGDLDQAQALFVRRHLPGCPACQRLLADFRQTTTWLVSQRDQPVDGLVLDELQRRLRARLGNRPPPSLPLALLGRAWEAVRLVAQPALALAVTGWLVLGGVQTWLDQDRPPRELLMSPVAVAVAVPSAQAALPSGEEAGPEEDLDEPVEAARLRIEMQTRDPDVRIIWFASNDSRPPQQQPEAPGRLERAR